MLYHRCDCIWIDVLQTHICLCPWKGSQLEPLCIHMLTTLHIYIYTYHITKLTYVYALASANTLNLLIYMHILTSIYISYPRHVCRWTHVEKTYICLCPCECSHLELLDIHAYTHKYTYISYHRYVLYMNPCFANSHMAVPMRVLTLRTSFIYTSLFK